MHETRWRNERKRESQPQCELDVQWKARDIMYKYSSSASLTEWSYTEWRRSSGECGWKCWQWRGKFPWRRLTTAVWMGGLMHRKWRDSFTHLCRSCLRGWGTDRWRSRPRWTSLSLVRRTPAATPRRPCRAASLTSATRDWLSTACLLCNKKSTSS